MIKFIALIFILSFVTINLVKSESFHSYGNINTIHSQNGNYFLQTLPYDNIGETTIGKTIVFNSDSNLVYEIERNFDIIENRRELFLSNDGYTIAYVISYEFYWKGTKRKSIEIYKKGILFKQYSLTDLIECDNEIDDCYLFYNESIDSIYWENGNRKIKFMDNISDFEKGLIEKATYLDRDTLYIFTKTNELLSIDLNSTEKYSVPLHKVNTDKFKNIKPFSSKSIRFGPNSSIIDFKLKNGQSLESELVTFLGMAVLPSEERYTNKYKSYRLEIQLLLDTTGKAKNVEVIFYDSLQSILIEKFIESQSFKTNEIPKEVEKWVFGNSFDLINKNLDEAIKERQNEIEEEKKEYKRRIVADSIEGVYIPKNIEECFAQLNILLKPKDIKELKNLDNRSETIIYHHGFGTWLRNNWGLWYGSRLKLYLENKGLDHPDDMSSTILEYYYDWLNENHEEWQKFEKQ